VGRGSCWRLLQRRASPADSIRGDILGGAGGGGHVAAVEVAAKVADVQRALDCAVSLGELVGAPDEVTRARGHFVQDDLDDDLAPSTIILGLHRCVLILGRVADVQLPACRAGDLEDIIADGPSADRIALPGRRSRLGGRMVVMDRGASCE
jgi:hypothetical protein